VDILNPWVEEIDEQSKGAEIQEFLQLRSYSGEPGVRGADQKRTRGEGADRGGEASADVRAEMDFLASDAMQGRGSGTQFD